MAKKKVAKKKAAPKKSEILSRGKKESCSTNSCSSSSCSSGGCMWFLGFVGAVIYYVSTATSFWMGVLGVLKALVWPVFVVMEVLSFLGA